MSRWNVADVMTIGAVSVLEDTPFKDIVDLLEAHEINAVPVTDSVGRVIGIVSTADLLPKLEFAGDDEHLRILESKNIRRARGKAHATAAGELMTAPATSVMGVTPLVTAAKIMEVEGRKRLPVVNDLGRLIGMVTRRDLLKVFLRRDDEIRDEIFASVVEGMAGVEPCQVRVEVDDGVVTLLGELERRSLIPMVVRQIERVDGVVDVVSHLSYQRDDINGPSLQWRAPTF